jgi:hypothetical protein
MKYIVILVLLLSSIANASEIAIENIDINKISNNLPKNWYVSEISNTASPQGWTKIEGDSGVVVILSRIPYSYKFAKSKSGSLEIYHPEYIFCVMPNNFVGKSANGTLFEKGKIKEPKNIPNRATLILGNFKKYNNYFIFYNENTYVDWKKPELLLEKNIIKIKEP